MVKKTAEFVTPRHPDKLCDRIADSFLDIYKTLDPASRVALEVMGGHGKIYISGEVTTKANADLIIAKDVIKKILGDYKFELLWNVVRQSPDIAKGVDTGGAGDQGIMVGYACTGTPNFMPLEYNLARQLCMDLYKQFPYDGKTQVTIEHGQPVSVVASFQNVPHDELEAAVKALIPAKEYFINPAGDWNQGGFEADSGLSGRKIIVDNYGPNIPVGGGSFSGKDYTKVDRSGAYMARKLAMTYLRDRKAGEVLVKLAYAIGKAEPVMANVTIDGSTEEIKGYDLTPAGIRKALDLDNVLFEEVCQWGHFGREFNWDKPI